MANQLSTKQKRMAELMLEGHTAVYAYKAAGYRGTPAKCASKIADNSGFKKYLSQLQKKSQTKAVATRAELLENASNILRDTASKDPRTSLAAGDQIAKLTGEYAPERFQAKVEHTPVQVVLKNLRLHGNVDGTPENE